MPPCPGKATIKQNRLGCLNRPVTKTFGKSYPFLRSRVSIFTKLSKKYLTHFLLSAGTVGKGKNKFAEAARVAWKGKVVVSALAPLPNGPTELKRSSFCLLLLCLKQQMSKPSPNLSLPLGVIFHYCQANPVHKWRRLE